MEWLSQPQAWVALLTLTALELVLGIDNIVFISILSGRLPEAQRPKARRLGLFLAMFLRIGLLVSLAWIMKLTAPLFSILGRDVSGRDLILIGGGLFLIAKSTHEIHNKLEGDHGDGTQKVFATFAAVLTQILLLDIVFSLDSVITAVGMVDEVPVMVTAIVVSVACMLFFAGPVSGFVERHPTVKMLALSFLLMIGVTLVADGLGFHIPKGYIYFSMAFSLTVEVLNLQLHKKSKKAAPVKLHTPYS